MTVGPAWLTGAAAAALALLALRVLFGVAARLPQAWPGPRSLHVQPVPRVGGLSIWAGFVPAVFLAGAIVPGSPWIWAASFLAVATVSLVDDLGGVHPAMRIAVHVIAAGGLAVAILGGGPGAGREASFWTIGAATLGLAWAANLYNFMDGTDGLAGLMAVTGFSAYGIAAAAAGGDGWIYWALAAAVLPFLMSNLPPARMFMGDVGAVPLGFLAAAFGLAGWHSGLWPGWFPLLVFLPFVADATVTLAARARRRERLWEAHKFHYYQRLHQLGGGHWGTLIVFGALMVGTGTSALIALALAPRAGWIVTIGWGGVLLALFLSIEHYWQRRNPKPQ